MTDNNKCHRKSILDPPCRPDKHDVSVKPPDPQAATPGDSTHGCGPRDVASANADHIIQLDSHQEHIGSRNSPIQQITDFGMSDIQFLDPRGSSSYEEHRLVHSNPTVCFQQTHTLDWFPPSILSSNLRRRGQFQELSPVTDPQYPQNSCFDQDHGSHPAETIDVNGFNYHDHNYF